LFRQHEPASLKRLDTSIKTRGAFGKEHKRDASAQSLAGVTKGFDGRMRILSIDRDMT
jgi:hypothetical protein